jgi:hypothetical protein
MYIVTGRPGRLRTVSRSPERVSSSRSGMPAEPAACRA